MSSRLTIEPTNRKKKFLSYEMKIILQKKFGGVIHDETMDLKDLGYVQGLIDAEIPGAKLLYEFIDRNEEILLNEEF